jgi:hypothetical protein
MLTTANEKFTFSMCNPSSTPSNCKFCPRNTYQLNLIVISSSLAMQRSSRFQFNRMVLTKWHVKQFRLAKKKIKIKYKRQATKRGNIKKSHLTFFCLVWLVGDGCKRSVGRASQYKIRVLHHVVIYRTFFYIYIFCSFTN